MLWLGVIVMIVGMVLRFGLSGDAAHWSGLAAIAVGAILVIGGLLLANRRRRTRRSGIRPAGEPLEYKTSGGKIAAMIIMAVYILSPIDFIPDFLLPVGVVDDVGALSWLALVVGQEFTRHRRSRQAIGG